MADPDSDSKLERPLSAELGTALDFDGLLKLAETHGVRYLKGVTCNNIGEPLGMGLWEGVPLRVAIWMARPVENIRRVYYYGYHNDDPAQMFQSSLPIGRVLEDPPGELPVLLCYKLNGEFLSGKRGGPVRMVVPEAYGFKSVKWLQRVVLTNDWQANDTYALGNNDLESPMKTFARFVAGAVDGHRRRADRDHRAGAGGCLGAAKRAVLAPPGRRGVAGRRPALRTLATGRTPTILPPPEHWGGGLPDDGLPGCAAPVRSGQRRAAHVAVALHGRALVGGVAGCPGRAVRAALPKHRSERHRPADAAAVRQVGAGRDRAGAGVVE